TRSRAEEIVRHPRLLQDIFRSSHKESTYDSVRMQFFSARAPTFRITPADCELSSPNRESGPALRAGLGVACDQIKNPPPDPRPASESGPACCSAPSGKSGHSPSSAQPANKRDRFVRTTTCPYIEIGVRLTPKRRAEDGLSVLVSLGYVPF